MIKMKVLGKATIFTLHGIFPGEDIAKHCKVMAVQLREMANALEGDEASKQIINEYGWGWYNWRLKTKRQRTTLEVRQGVERKFS